MVCGVKTAVAVAVVWLAVVAAWEEKVLLEKELVGLLKNVGDQLETSLTSIYQYVDEVNKIYDAECPNGRENCPQDIIVERIVGNPVYNYQLLKRIIVFYKKVENSINKIDLKGASSALKKLKKQYGGIPDEEDQKHLGKGILRLIETYNLQIEDLLHGVIGSEVTSAKLTGSDLLYLGKLASSERRHDLSVKILNELANGNHTAAEDRVPASRLLGVEEARRKRTNQQLFGAEEENSAGRAAFNLGVVPPKTNIREKMICEDDKINYYALCKGNTLADPAIMDKLQCYYSTQGQPYFTIHPIAIEVAYPAPHQILIFHDVLSTKESDELIQDSKPLMQTSQIGSNKEVSENRVSTTAFIVDGRFNIVDKINARINLITGLNGALALDEEGKKEEFEYLQVASYDIGGHFYLHHDPMYVYKDSGFLAQSVEDPSRPYNTGDRMSTLMFYVSEVQQGGNTAFPRLGVTVRPRRGSAVFWHNIDRDGFSDMHMLHAACPVLLGKKVVANKWFREVANQFHRKCGKHRENPQVK